jgi:hypothetical protein
MYEQKKTDFFTKKSIDCAKRLITSIRCLTEQYFFIEKFGFATERKFNFSPIFQSNCDS